MQTAPAKRFYCYPATNEVEGPFELVELAGLLQEKLINGETPTLREGEEAWLLFQDRPEYHLAHEMPASAIASHAKEKADAKVSSFHPKKLLPFLWFMAPVLLYVLYRVVRIWFTYHFGGHDGNGLDANGNPLP